MSTAGHIVALQAQLDDVGEALGPKRLRAADGYHGTAVRTLLRAVEDVLGQLRELEHQHVLSTPEQAYRDAVRRLAEALDTPSEES